MSLYRARGNGIAGKAMAVPVIEGEKWCRLTQTYTCVIKWPLRTVRSSLGCLRGLLQTFQVFKHPNYQQEN